MIEASKIFVGEHDFASFTKNHKIENTVRTIYSIDFDIKDKVVCIKFKGNGFLHNMIRIIVAMLIEVGNNRLEIEKLKICQNWRLKSIFQNKITSFYLVGIIANK